MLFCLLAPFPHKNRSAFQEFVERLSKSFSFCPTEEFQARQFRLLTRIMVLFSSDKAGFVGIPRLVTSNLAVDFCAAEKSRLRISVP